MISSFLKRIVGEWRSASSSKSQFAIPYEVSLRNRIRDNYFDLSVQEKVACAERLGALSRRPKLSFVIPIYNTPTYLLEACLLSTICQSYTDLEIILVDDGSTLDTLSPVAEVFASLDPRINFIRSPENGGISRASNLGLIAATGEFICLLDHDDELMPNAALVFAEHINANAEIDAWYSDQVKCDVDGALIDHFYKPDWSPIYFLGVMYVGHLLGVRSELAREIEFDPAFDGVQDYEFMLRLSERTQRIGHVAEALYKWRAAEGSLASSASAKDGISELHKRAVENHLSRTGRSWRVEIPSGFEHRLVIRASDTAKEPSVSVVIPSKNQGELVSQCLDSLITLTDYSNFEVIIVDNMTTDPLAKAAFARHNVTQLLYENNFNYSAANNLGVRHAQGEFLVFLNNDTEVIDSNWLSDLVSFFEDPEVGAVGPTLLYADRRVQHAGVVLGARGTADHVMRYFQETWDGYAGSLICAREVSAVTAACLIMRKSLFESLGGFSEDFSKHYQDLDLCLKIRELGLKIINAGYVRMIHHESASRKMEGYDLGDRAILVDRWHSEISAGDPFYNRAFDVQALDYSLIKH